MKKLSLLLIPSLAAAVCLVAHAQQARKLEFRMKPGESATYGLHAMTSTQYVSHKARGTDKRTILFKSDMRVLLRCIKVSPDGVVLVEIMYPDFTMETAVTESGGTRKIVTDKDGARSYVDGKLQEQSSWEQLERQGRPNLKKLFSSIIQFTVDKTGKVLDVKTPAGLTARFPGVDIKQFFRNQVIFPQMPIAPGSEWSYTSDREVPQGPAPLGGRTMVDKTTYQYQHNETTMGRECARIRTVITSRPKDQIPNLKEFKQTNEGWSLIGLDNGLVVMSQMTLSQEMKGAPGGINTEVITTGEVTTTMLKPAPSQSPSSENKPPSDAR